MAATFTIPTGALSKALPDKSIAPVNGLPSKELALIVVAAFITLYLALTRPDPVITEDYYRQGIEINKTLGDDAQAASMAPALQARNHAQTGFVPSSKAVNRP